MSSVGQALGGIVGGTIGFFVGGPAGALKGAQIGIMAGGIIDPPPGPVINGPRLDDLSVQTSTYGAFIPRNYGTIAQTGNVFWLKGDALTETPVSTESGGKGGPTTTTNTWDYSATFAVGLCQGPIDGVRRIWIGNQLWYDAGSDDIQSIIASNESSSLFTLYLGTDTQLPDPLIQSDKGAANVSAYRGLAYIVFDNLPLADYNNSLVGAQVKVEIAKINSPTFVHQSLDAQPSGSYYCGTYGNGMLIIMPHGSTYRRSYDGETFITEAISTANRTNIVWTGKNFVCTRDSGSLVDISSNGVTWGTAALPSSGEWRGLAYGNGVLVATQTSGTVAAYSLDHGATWVATTLPSARWWQRVAWNGSVFCVIAETSSYFAISADGINWTEQYVAAITYQWYGIAAKDGVFCAVAYTGTGGGRAATSSDGVTWTTNRISIANYYRSVVSGDRYFCAVTWGDKYAALSTDGITWTEVNLGANGFWNVSGAIGDLFYMARYVPPYLTGATVSVVRPSATYGTPISLGDVVESECLTSNLLTAGDLDVTELTDSVRGYRIASQGAIRGGIDPLRAAWPFDVVQHGYQIKFKRRGSASVATIDASELDARSAGSDPGVQITNSRDMDTLLPRLLTLKYIDADREYDVNEQPAQRGA